MFGVRPPPPPLTHTHRTPQGYTPLHVASLHGHHEIAQLLLRHGASAQDITELSHSPLHFACQYNHTVTAQLLISYGAKINGQDHNGNTPLHFCCSNGHAESAKVLLDRSADVSIANNRGDTPLHNAARWGYAGIVSLLLAAKADVTAQNKRKRTPLQDAQSKEVVDLLQSLGRDKIEETRGLSSHVALVGVPGFFAFINGIYERIGELPSDWYLGITAPEPALHQQYRPLFRHRRKVPKDHGRFSEKELYLYYFPQRTVWAISTIVGGDDIIAYSAGDVRHPSLLKSVWSILNDPSQPGYRLELDIEASNSAPPEVLSPESAKILPEVG